MSVGAYFCWWVGKDRQHTDTLALPYHRDGIFIPVISLGLCKTKCCLCVALQLLLATNINKLWQNNIVLNMRHANK